MTGDANLLGTLHSISGEGVVRMTARFDLAIDDVWAALTEPGRLAHWYGEVTGDLTIGEDIQIAITLSGPRLGRIEMCQPPQRLGLTLRDPDARPDQPEQTRLTIQLTPEDGGTRLEWEERALPVKLLSAYGTGIQVHVEHLSDYLRGHDLRDAEQLWGELFPVYEALGISSSP